MGACKKDAKNDEAAPATPATTKVTETPTAVTDTETPPKAAWTGDDTAKALGDCWAAFNAKETEKFLGCYAADADFSYIDFAPPMTLKGPEAIAGAVKMWWGAFPDANGQAQLLLANENNFAGIILTTQTNTGEGMMPPTGKKVANFEAQFGSFNAEGKLAADHHHVDQATMAHQMGMHKSEMSPDSEEAWPEQIVVVAKNDDAEKANVELIKSLDAFVQKQDVAGMVAAVSDDISFRYVGHKAATTDKAGYEKGVNEWMGMVKLTSRDVKSIWGAGDWVFATSEVTVKTLKDMPDAKGTKDKDIKLTQTEFFRVADGKITNHWVFENTMQYPIQLGLMDPSKMGAHPEEKKAKK